MKIRNSMIYIGTAILIFTIFQIPQIGLKQVEQNLEKQVYEKEKVKTAIDIDTEELYLVKAIHEMEDGNSTIEITSTKEQQILVNAKDQKFLVDADDDKQKAIGLIEKELLKLKEFGILKEFAIEDASRYDYELIQKEYYQDKNKKYVLYDVIFMKENQMYEMEIEEKTGKIIHISVENNSWNITNQEMLMKNFIQYLDLYIVEDWKYENQQWQSEKAQLAVSLTQGENLDTLSIHTIGRNQSHKENYASQATK